MQYLVCDMDKNVHEDKKIIWRFDLTAAEVRAWIYNYILYNTMGNVPHIIEYELVWGIVRVITCY